MTQARLSISSFKKLCLHILEVALFLALLVGMGQFFRYILNDDTNVYTRTMFHELYAQEQNIDVLFLGSSHTYRAFDPAITDEIFQKNTFNAGSSAQPLDASYAILVEAGKHNALQEVYLDLYFAIAASTPANRTNPTEVYIVSDYLKPSFNKYRFLAQATLPESWINGFVVARRDWQNIFKPKIIRRTVSRKDSDAYKNYEYLVHENDYYAGKGYVVSQQAITPGTFCGTSTLSIADNQISEFSQESLNRIITYCQKNNIKLTLLSCPMSDFRLLSGASSATYDKYIHQVKEIAEPCGIEYYDFNLCKPEYFSGQDDYFYDTSHLSQAGATAFSTLFSNLFTGQLSPQDVFYSSYEEKIAAQSTRVYGFHVSKKNSDGARIGEVVATENAPLEFKISNTYQDADGNTVEEIANDFSTEREIVLPNDVSGTCTVVWRLKGSTQETTQNFEY